MTPKITRHGGPTIMGATWTDEDAAIPPEPELEFSPEPAAPEAEPKPIEPKPARPRAKKSASSKPTES